MEISVSSAMPNKHALYKPYNTKQLTPYLQLIIWGPTARGVNCLMYTRNHYTWNITSQMTHFVLSSIVFHSTRYGSKLMTNHV